MSATQLAPRPRWSRATLALSLALGPLAMQCGDDSGQDNVSGPRAGNGGSEGGGSPEGGSTAPGGQGGASDGGAAAGGESSGRGGNSGRGGTAGQGEAGTSSDAGAGQGGTGGTDPGHGGGGAAGMPGGEGGMAGEDGGGGEPGCQDPPSTNFCTGDLSGIGTGDFEVKFTIRAGGSQAVYAVINQRDTCGHSYFWSAKLLYGSLYVELDDNNQHYVDCWSPVWLNDGQFHRVVVRRTSGVLSIVVDCGDPWMCSAPTDFSRQMAPLGSATFDPCIGLGTVPLEGNVTDRCVRPL